MTAWADQYGNRRPSAQPDAERVVPETREAARAVSIPRGHSEPMADDAQRIRRFVDSVSLDPKRHPGVKVVGAMARAETLIEAWHRAPQQPAPAHVEGEAR